MPRAPRFVETDDDDDLEDNGRPAISVTIERYWELLEILPSDPPGLTPDQLLTAGEQQFKWTIDIRTIHRYLRGLKERRLAQIVDEDLPPREPRRWILSPERNADKRRMETGKAVAYLLLDRIAHSMLPAELLVSLQADLEKAREHARLRRKADPRLGWTDKVAFVPDTLRRLPPALDKKVLKTLQTALLDGKQVECEYLSRDRKRSEHDPRPKVHILEIRGLVQRGVSLYAVVTYASKPERVGAYPLARFVSAKLLTTRVTHRPETLQDYLDQGVLEFDFQRGRISLRARIDDDEMVTLREAPLSEDQEIRATTRGNFVTATVLDSRMLENYLLSHCTHIEVLEPTELRERLSAKLQKAAKVYSE